MARSSAGGPKARGRPAPAPPAAGHREESAELAEVRAQLRELQQTIEAIRTGNVDSLIIGPPGQEQIYALATADRSYRLIVEAMNEGTATVSPRGIILDANPRLGSMTGQNASELIGTPVLDLVPDAHRAAFALLLEAGAGDSARGEVDLSGPAGTLVPVLLAVSGFDLDGMLLRCLVLTDLSAQRAAESRVRVLTAELEARVKQRTAELERSNKFSRALLDAGFELGGEHPDPTLRCALRAEIGEDQAPQEHPVEWRPLTASRTGTRVPAGPLRSLLRRVRCHCARLRGGSANAAVGVRDQVKRGVPISSEAFWPVIEPSRGFASRIIPRGRRWRCLRSSPRR